MGFRKVFCFFNFTELLIFCGVKHIVTSFLGFSSFVCLNYFGLHILIFFPLFCSILVCSQHFLFIILPSPSTPDSNQQLSHGGPDKPIKRFVLKSIRNWLIATLLFQPNGHQSYTSFVAVSGSPVPI